MTATPTAPPCSQPGCTGSIADGYCDVCGMPPAAAPAGPAPAGVSAAPSIATVASASAQGEPAGVASTSTRSSGRLESAALGSARAKGTQATRRITGSARLRSARLGGGVTTVPPAPEVDAANALLVNPMVPEGKRFCSKCGERVGRSIDGQPGRVKGFCPKCRQPFSFEPKLAPGDLVAGQYEVAGCLAHGGLGWIYLAKDRNVSNRWVVLKGLLNSADPDALAAAIAEQRFLAQVSHPNIVEIYNFVTNGDDGYIVMEYVGGHSLKSILQDRMRAGAGVYQPFPVDQALAYIIEILPAFTYLHDLGLLFCDFKPDNIIQICDEVRLIDLGGVRRVDDDDSTIFGTVGYQAPEVAELGTSVASDIYTIGRTLMVLTTEFRGYQTKYVDSLPPVDETPVFQKYDSFYRLILKACAPSRDDRFASADELRVQMTGVLREVVAIDRGIEAAQSSLASLLFEAPGLATDDVSWASLPALRPDPADPQAGWLQTLSSSDSGLRMEQLASAPDLSPEVLLDTAKTALRLGRHGDVTASADLLLQEDPWEWRALWVQGLEALDRGDAQAARGSFNAVYGQVPGETAPKLALAYSCELSGELDVAENLYAMCARTDASYIPTSAFGMYRIRRSRGDIDGAAAALNLIPDSSSKRPLAKRAQAAMLITNSRTAKDLADAVALSESADFPPPLRAELQADVYRRARQALLAQAGASDTLPIPTIGRFATDDQGLRRGLEASLRELARLSTDRDRKIALVDEANHVRPWSLW